MKKLDDISLTGRIGASYQEGTESLPRRGNLGTIPVETASREVEKPGSEASGEPRTYHRSRHDAAALRELPGGRGPGTISLETVVHVLEKQDSEASGEKPGSEASGERTDAPRYHPRRPGMRKTPADFAGTTGPGHPGRQKLPEKLTRARSGTQVRKLGESKGVPIGQEHQRIVGAQRTREPGKPALGRLMTKDQLKAALGRPPERNEHFLDAFRKDSHAAKELKAALKDYHRLLGKLSVSSDPRERVEQARQLAQCLDGVEAKLATADRKSPLARGLADERRLIDAVSKDVRLNNQEGHQYGWLEALEFKRHGIGISPDACVTRFQESNLEKVKELGSGNINKVYRATYKSGDVCALKPLKANEKAQPVGREMGIPNEQPRLGNRNIAAHKIDKLLDAGVTAGAEFALHEGQLHLAMELVPGLSGNGEAVTRPAPEEKAKAFNMEYDKVGKGEKTPDAFRKYVEGNRAELRFDSKGRPTYLVSVHLAYRFNYDDPGLQRALSNLEWMDALSGQGDRHPGNYLIILDEKGKFAGLKGIDNDTSFGKRWTSMKEVKDEANDPHGPPSSYLGIGLPKLIDRRLADEFRRPDKWDEIRAELGPLLDPEEIVATKARFDELLRHIDDLEKSGHVVDDWAEWRGRDKEDNAVGVKEFLADHPTGSYLGRDMELLAGKESVGLAIEPPPGRKPRK